MIHDPVFSMRVAIMLFSTFIIAAAAFSAWYRRNNEDKSSFWFSIGVALHWSATGNSCLFSALEEAGIIDFPMKDVLLPANLGMIWAAGCFYFRAMTLHINDTFWKIVASIVLTVFIIVYTFQTIYIFEGI